jgi:SAM-dependent methyltransferase
MDPWADWLLSRRGSRATLEPLLHTFRDGVLDGARIQPGDVVLDVGTGDGLIGFGALERGASVIFSDVSARMLQVCRASGDEAGRVVQTAADGLGLRAGCVDVVTARSVLIYVDRKAEAFAEFFRVLRPGGRLSIFEPINSFVALHGGYRLFGLDLTPLAGLMDKLRSAFEDAPALVGFDERHLLLAARAAGFTALELDYRVEWDVPAPAPVDWAAQLHTAPNPLAPTYAEAIAAALSPAERDDLYGFLRDEVAAGAPAFRTMAGAYLRATRGPRQ